MAEKNSRAGMLIPETLNRSNTTICGLHANFGSVVCRIPSEGRRAFREV
jgi:hypothetical protein